MISNISPRLGIKSSLPKHLQAFITAYLIWKTNNKSTIIEYSQEYRTSENKTSIKFKDEIINALKNYLSLSSDSDLFDRNPLIAAQIEHLQVGLLNCYKTANISFVKTRSNSSERTEGHRYEKQIEYTSFIDLFDCFVSQNNDSYIGFFILILKEDNSFKNHHLFKSFSGFISFLIEQTQYKLYDNSVEDMLYKKLERNIDFFKDGPARILKLFVSEGLYNLSLSNPQFNNKKNRINNLFEIFRVRYDLEESPLAEKPVTESFALIQGYNKIIYGAPGAGKSYKVNKIIGNRDHYIRTVFHPETQYSDFVGCLRPHKNEDGNITYSFRKGPFIRILEKALLNPATHYYLVIEELNRANTAAVFGEIFQLLDRDEKGQSEYPISIQDEDLFDALVNDHEGKLRDNPYIGKRELIIPNNLSIIATMNSSDQAVFPLDTAFKRRWIFEYLPIDFTESAKGQIPINYAKKISIEWVQLAETINIELMHLGVVEDKLIGPWFIKNSDLIDETTARETFIGKICSYLWDDALRYKDKGAIFNSNIRGYGQLHQLYKEGQSILSEDFINKLMKTEDDDGSE